MSARRLSVDQARTPGFSIGPLSSLAMLDLIVVGGGIVGLGSAIRYSARHPGRSVLVLEKEEAFASHQTGHNSGVLHSGIYYEPGSLKARNCVRGKELMEAFCREHGVPFETRGKLIVATDPGELGRLGELRKRGRANGVKLIELDERELRSAEPAVRGVAAIEVPGTGIVDYSQVAQAFVRSLRAEGHELLGGQRIEELEVAGNSVRVTAAGGKSWTARQTLVCGGLQSDRLAKGSGAQLDLRIVPFLGEYRALKPEHSKLVKRLIYPVPDPRFPFLGVHLTPRMDGRIDCGPNALPAFAREGYAKLAFSPRDALANLTWPGFWRLARRQWPMARAELYRSLSSRAFARALQNLVPSVLADWFESAPSGVRAQAVDRHGSLIDDYAIRRQGPLLHLLNAPSPAATSCLAIGDHLVDELHRES